MAAPTTKLYDGDFTKAVPIGPLIPSQDVETRAVLLSQKFLQQAAFWSPAPIGSAGPGTGSFLTDETTPTPTGTAGLVEWTRNYAKKPPQLPNIPQPDQHTYQEIVNGKLLSVTLPVTAYIQKRYYHQADPSTIPLLLAFGFVVVDNVIYEYGTPPAPSANTIVGSDSVITRWKGNWWCRMTKFIPIKSFNPPS